MAEARPNKDDRTVAGFGEEWQAFDQSKLPERDGSDMFQRYFGIFPWHALPPQAEGFDLGCGSGRWARMVAPRVGRLHCIDPSDALEVARRNLSSSENCEFHRADVSAIPLAESSMDFGYSLGVLHHVPDTVEGLRQCVRRLKPGAPFLLYLYYNFDNKPAWYRALWWLSDVARRAVAACPFPLRLAFSSCVAVLVYYPLARGARLLERLGMRVDNLPLSPYRTLSLYTMRTDALDRFGTRLERRFSRTQIRGMMEQAGLEGVVFSDHPPFWCACGRRRETAV